MIPIVLPPGTGRRYAGGPLLTAIFKADEAETAERCSVSEWCLDPGFAGVGAHAHEANDEIFRVVDGRPELLVGEAWHQEAGSFVRVPAGVTHDFRNASDAAARLLNVSPAGSSGG